MTKVYFHTLGCSTNQAESEIMAGLLEEAGYEIVDDKESSDINVLNVCTVKGNETALKQVKELKQNKPMILTGCIPRNSVDEFKEVLPSSPFVNTDNIDHITEVVQKLEDGEVIDKLAFKKDIKVGFPRRRRNRYIAIIPINEGCNDFCTYCSTKLIKGNTKSYPEEMILDEIKTAVNEGCKEIWLTSQDLAAYGWDKEKKSLLPDLVKKITEIEGNFKIRLGMFNPMNIKNQVEELINAMDNEKVYKFIHIPVQAGDDKILDAMRRRYTNEEFREMISKFKTKWPDITISTDVIVGFPGETEEQFEKTEELVKDIGFEVLNISRFKARVGTRAFMMKDQVFGNVSKDRSRKLTKIYEEKVEQMNNEWMNWKGKVLLAEKRKDIIGRNYAYKLIVMPDANDEDLGREIDVEIYKYENFCLFGRKI